MCGIEHKVNESYSTQTPRAKDNSNYNSFSSSYSGSENYPQENY